MFKYRCKVCNYFFDELKENMAFEKLPKSWKCPVCNTSKDMFIEIKEKDIKNKNMDFNKNNKTVENNMADEDSFKTAPDVMIEQMVAWGIKYVFGIPGTSSLGVVEAVRKNKDIEYFQVRHEQTAAMMASAYGKLTGNIAACLTIAGPGATNLATGLYDATLDKSPVLVITGHVQRKLIGTKAFQEINQHEFF
ncbi:thiamine pyrophosphate-binding protein [Methanobrevibacter arboriphilus]|nr:thiamine pyrophosphate-binding protein [Methanobrevibacter arboriphilus]